MLCVNFRAKGQKSKILFFFQRFYDFKNVQQEAVTDFSEYFAGAYLQLFKENWRPHYKKVASTT